MKKGIHFLWMLDHKEYISILEIFKKRFTKAFSYYTLGP
jgi:hypothetical protein